MPARTINAPRKTAKRPQRPPPHVPIGALRHVAKWSLTELAERIAEHTGRAPGKGTLCAIESGKRGASMDILIALEAVYGLEPGTISTTWDAKAPRGKSAVAA